MLARRDFNGRLTSYQYDALGRLSAKLPDAAAFPSDPGVAWTYTALGQRASMTDASGVTTYGYDRCNTR